MTSKLALMTDKLHQRLLDTSPGYADWHKQKYHSFYNWGFFLFASLILVWMSMNLARFNSEEVFAQVATSTTVTFDNPSPPGAADDLLNGVFGGIDFGTGNWRWSGPYASNPTNNIYFSSNVTSRPLAFSGGEKILESIRVYTSINSGTLTLSSSAGPDVVRTINPGSMVTVSTGWTAPSLTVNVFFTSGENLGVDDIVYRSSETTPPPPPGDTTPPTVSLTAPASGATVSGSAVTVSADASDPTVAGQATSGVAGVQFRLDDVNLGAEDTSAPYSIVWNTTTATNGTHTLTAVARDAVGNATTSVAVSVMVNNTVTPPPPPPSADYMLRFYGNGTGDIDRVKIQVGDTDTNAGTAPPGPPVDVGASDFTVEFWARGTTADNPAGTYLCGANNNWITGNIILDRDRFNQPRAYGISFGGGRVGFGVDGPAGDSRTICNTANTLDGAWHHYAFQRRASDGLMSTYVDGALVAQADGPDGDISYPDNGVPGNYCNGPCTWSDPYLVIGAEKHDDGPAYPSFDGFFDELRISNVLRYNTNFARPSGPFTTDTNTVALYHLNEGTGDTITDSSGVSGGPSNGIRRFGGFPSGPEWQVSSVTYGGTPPPPGDTTPPSTPGTPSATNVTQTSLTLSWSASTDNVGVTGYRVERCQGSACTNFVQIAAPTGTSFNDSGLVAGTVYRYRVRATDAAGNLSTYSAITSVTTSSAPPPSDTTPPTVSLTAPTSGATVSGSAVTVSANASDPTVAGQATSGVAGVQFRLDGANLGAEDTSSPYSITWNTTSATNGTHTLTALARDAAGNSAASSGITVTVFNTPPPPPSTTTPVATYNFNEGSGTTVADASGNGNTGTISGATWTTSGRNGGALSFDGVNDRVTVVDAPELDLTNGMTLSAWVYPTSLSNWRTIVGKEGSGSLAYFLHTNGSLGAVGATFSSEQYLLGGNLSLNTWTHLAGTYDGSNLRLYVNGVQVASRAISGNITTSVSPLRIGGNNIYGEYFRGRIDDVRVYNRVLSASEITSNMNTPVTGQ